MKKTLLAILVVLCLSLLVACGNNTPPVVTDAPITTTEAVATTTEAPVTTEDPAVTDAPVITEAPVTTSATPATTTEAPVTTTPPIPEEPESPFTVKNLTVGGVDISEYVIVYGSDKNAELFAEALKTRIYNLCGVTLSVVNSSTPEAEYEILLGSTGRSETKEKLSLGCVTIAINGKKIIAYGAKETDTEFALTYLINNAFSTVKSGKSHDLDFEDKINWKYVSHTLTATNLPKFQKLEGLYDVDFTNNQNVLDRFEITVEELPNEIAVLSPYETEYYPLSYEKEVFVAPDGDDKNAGTIDAPFATIEAAARKLISTDGGIIWVRGGLYELDKPVSISNVSGSVTAPVFIAAYEDETPVFTSGKLIDTSVFEPVDYEKDTEAKKIPESVREHVLSVNLYDLGWTDEDIGEISKNGAPSLYINGKQVALARYPNEGEPEMYFEYVFETGSVTSKDSNLYTKWLNRVKSGEFDNRSKDYYTDGNGNKNIDLGWQIRITDFTPCLWENTGDIWYYGNVFEGWEFGYYNIESFDIKTKKITSKSGSVYGAKVSSNSPTGYNNYYLFNILEALDTEGEWFIDRDTGVMYIYAPDNFEDATLIYCTVKDENAINVNNCKNLVIDGLTVSGSSGVGIYVTNSNSVVIERCTVNCTNKNSINVTTLSKNCAVIYNDVSVAGSSMINMDPSNRTYANMSDDRNIVQNNYCHDPKNRVVSGVVIGGHHSVVSHNTLVDCRISFASSTECIVEYNDISGGSPDVSDGGLIYLVGYNHIGNHIRYNYLHDWNVSGSGIYFDDLSSFNYAYGNVIDTTAKTNTKKTNLLYSSSGHYNVFVDNIIIARAQDYIQESCLYFDNSTSLGYRFNHKSASQVKSFTKDYNQSNLRARFPEIVAFTEKMSQHVSERSASGHVRNELEIYLRSPANNIVKNNVVLGTDVPIYKPLENLKNSVTGNNMTPTSLYEDNYTDKDIKAIFPNYASGDFTITDAGLSAIKEVISDFEMFDVTRTGLTK